MNIRLFIIFMTVALSATAAKPKAKVQPSNRSLLEQAQGYFESYDFEQARTSLEKYLSKRSKADEALDQQGARDEALLLKERIDMGQSMLDRVEKIEIIDSINVPARDFFKFMKLAPSAGRLISSSEIRNLAGKKAIEASPAFVTEDGETVIWSDGSLQESSLLADGTWEEPQLLMDYSTSFGEASGTELAYPFLMNDGVTLYFAADGGSSLGGMDIFISRRDEEGGFLQPSNIGMPYNSPDNDYMYAIDEEAGLGYWVSDRDAPEGMVTIYTFIPQEMRSNYPADYENLVSLAQAFNITDTHNPDKDYKALLSARDEIASQKPETSKPLFAFSMPGGITYTSFDDFRTSQGRRAMKEYMAAKKALSQKKMFLAKLREQYDHGNRGVAQRIMALENEIPVDERQLKQLSNAVVKAETSN